MGFSKGEHRERVRKSQHRAKLAIHPGKLYFIKVYDHNIKNFVVPTTDFGFFHSFPENPRFGSEISWEILTTKSKNRPSLAKVHFSKKNLNSQLGFFCSDPKQYLKAFPRLHDDSCASLHLIVGGTLCTRSRSDHLLPRV